MRQTASPPPLTLTTAKPTASLAADGFDPFIHALTLALGDGWSLQALFADLAILQHPSGGVTVSLSKHVRRKPQWLIYGNFKLCLGAEPGTLNGDRGKHTLYRATNKTPEQIARALKRHLLTAYWRDYAQAKEGCYTTHTIH